MPPRLEQFIKQLEDSGIVDSDTLRDLIPPKSDPQNADELVTRVKDLSPLKGMPLRSLDFGATPVSDLAPLRGMRLEYLNCSLTRVSDLSPIRGMPLKELRCDFVAARDTEILRGISTLSKINELSVDEFWRAAGADSSGINQ